MLPGAVEEDGAGAEKNEVMLASARGFLAVEARSAALRFRDIFFWFYDLLLKIERERRRGSAFIKYDRGRLRLHDFTRLYASVRDCHGAG